VDDPNILKRGGEDNLSAPSSLIANAHNEIHRKSGFLKKYEPMGEGRTPPPSPLESATAGLASYTGHAEWLEQS